MIKIQPSGDYVQLIYVDTISESVQEELKSDTDAIEYGYNSDGKIYLQFGRMTFDGFDPTIFEIDGSPVTDAADFVTKLTALFSDGSGGGSFDIHALDDADILTGSEEVPLYQVSNKKVTVNDLLPVQLQEDKSIDMNGHKLTLGFNLFDSSSNSINRVGAQDNSVVLNTGMTYYITSAIDITTNIEASFDDDGKLAQITLKANVTRSLIQIFAEHIEINEQPTFNGTLADAISGGKNVVNGLIVD